MIAGRGLVEWLNLRPVLSGNELREVVRVGFSPRSVGEDQFDAFVGLLGMLDVVSGYLAEGAPKSADIT